MVFRLPPFLGFTLLVLFGGICGKAQTPPPSSASTPQQLSTSPDGKFLVRRSVGEPGEHGEARKSLEICSADGTPRYAWESGLGVTTLLWSPDSRYLAVNDMPGEQGDLVRVFSLDPVKSTVDVVREPNGKRLLERQQERHGTFLSTVDKIQLRAVEWKEGKLWCLLTGTSHPKRQPSVHVPFHHLLVFGLSPGEPPMIEEEWTLTDPRERSYRDQP